MTMAFQVYLKKDEAWKAGITLGAWAAVSGRFNLETKEARLTFRGSTTDEALRDREYVGDEVIQEIPDITTFSSFEPLFAEICAWLASNENSKLRGCTLEAMPALPEPEQ
jgi:hypothetical protein